MDILCKNNKCLICDSNMTITSINPTIDAGSKKLCANGCCEIYQYINGKTHIHIWEKEHKPFESKIFITNHDIISEKTKMEVKNYVDYWKTNDRYLIQLLET